MPRMPIAMSRTGAEKMFNRKADPDASLTPKSFMSKKIGGIKDKVIDKVSDAMSYPARRAAQKSMIQSDKNFKEFRGNRIGESVGKAIGKLGMQKGVLKSLAPVKSTQRDDYAKAMARATKAGGSSGVGVGY